MLVGGGTRGGLARYLLAAVLLLAVSVSLGLAPARPTGGARALTTGWQYKWSDLSSVAPLDDDWDSTGWSPLTLPAHPPRNAGEILWLRTRLPVEPRYRDPSLAFDAIIAPFEAFVGKERVHVNPDPDGLATKWPSGIPWQLVRLPDDPGGKTFLLRIRSDGQSALVRGTPFYGDRTDHLTWTLKRDIPRLACGLLIVLIGLVGAVAVMKRTDWKAPLGFGVWTVTLGLYIVNYTHAKELIAGGPRAWFAVWVIILPTLPVGGLLFVDTMFGTGPRGLLARVFRVALGYGVVLLALDVFCVWLYRDRPQLGATIWFAGTTLERLLYVVTIVAGVIVVLRRAREGNVEARIFLAGLSAHFALAMNELLAAFGVATLSWKSMTHLGALSLTLALAFILQRRYTSALERAAAYAAEVLVREREKERLLRDLHDGVGGLTSNIRVLAELGQKNDDRARRSLSTIAELSGKALLELRAFVQALDETTTTWEALAAELRRFGGQLMSAAGATFEMKSELATREPPRGLLSLHILRMFQESITNALKHGAGNVVVSLRADDTGVELVVASEAAAAKDGDIPRERRGIDLGRGVGNMRARAAEVGGTFTLEQGPPTTVRLHVPLPLQLPIPTIPPDTDAGGAIPSR
jgi:signal transduction histidine kinase